MKPVNEVLRALRLERQLSAKALAKLMGVSGTLVGDTESAKRSPTVAVLIRYAETFPEAEDLIFYAAGRISPSRKLYSVSSAKFAKGLEAFEAVLRRGS